MLFNKLQHSIKNTCNSRYREGQSWTKYWRRYVRPYAYPGKFWRGAYPIAKPATIRPTSNVATTLAPVCIAQPQRAKIHPIYRGQVKNQRIGCMQAVFTCIVLFLPNLSLALMTNLSMLPPLSKKAIFHHPAAAAPKKHPPISQNWLKQMQEKQKEHRQTIKGWNYSALDIGVAAEMVDIMGHSDHRWDNTAVRESLLQSTA